MATVYFTKPVTSDLRADVLAYLRDAINSQARMFEGDTLVSPPVNAVRYVAANNRFEKWSGSVWDPLNITGNVTPTPPGGSTNQVQFNAGGGNFGGSANLTWDGTNKLLSIESRPALVHFDGLTSGNSNALDTITNAKSLGFFPASGTTGTQITHRWFQWSATQNRGWALAHNHPVSGSGTGEMYFNALQGSTWQGWKKLWHEGNFDPTGAMAITPGANQTGLNVAGPSNAASGYYPAIFRMGSAQNYGKVIALSTQTSPSNGSDGPQIHFIREGVYEWGFGIGSNTNDMVMYSGGSASTFGTERFRFGTGGLLTASQFHATNNGAGTNYRVGDDAWIGDIDVANTIGIKGYSDASSGFIRFGSNTSALGVSGGGALTWGGAGVQYDWRQGIFGAGSYMWDWWRMRNAADNQTVHLQCNSAGTFTLANTPWNLTTLQVDQSGNLTATGNVTAYSDERLKTNFRPFHLSLDHLLSVQTEEYDRTDNGHHQFGVRAQALRRIMPLAIQEDEGGILSVDYGKAALVATLNLAREVAILKAQMEAS
jgi:Chaperone of endosialidase